MSVSSSPRLAVLNPNTNTATTQMMLAAAQAHLAPEITAKAYTMTLGPLVIADEAALEAAARQIVLTGESLAAGEADGLLISGFGDPGVAALRARTKIPVVGIAEAAMAEAAAHGRFSIVTTTPDLRGAILGQVERYGHGDTFASLLISQGGVARDMADADAMTRALLGLTEQALQDGAQAIVIGGGPLARAFDALKTATPVPVIEPVAAGARQISRLLMAKRG